jgi:hypothetical protein
VKPALIGTILNNSEHVLLPICSHPLSLNIIKSYIIKYWIKWQHGLWVSSQYKTNVKNLSETINSETDKTAYIVLEITLHDPLELKIFKPSLYTISNLPLRIHTVNRQQWMP